MVPSSRRAALLLGCYLVPAALAAAAPSPESRWLQQYLRFDSSNPPGNEAAAAEWLAARFAERSIAAEILTSPAGRANLVALLPANSTTPPTGGIAASRERIVLLHHIDVVPAGDRSGWRHDPFAGELAGGSLWGRGAIDAKGLGIAHLAAFLDLAARQDRTRDLLFLATADEEAGGREGVGWLFESRPDLFAGVVAVLNEGGTGKSVGGRPLWWGIEVDQKRPLWLAVTARGREGHGSSAEIASASHRLVEGLARVLATAPALRGSPSAVRYLEALGRHDPRAARAAREGARLGAGTPPEELDRSALVGYENLFRDSLQVTTLRGSERINVVPGEARAEIDVRLLPETDERLFLDEIRRRLGAGLELDVMLRSPPATASPTDNAVYRTIAEHLRQEAPVVPAFLPAFTDARYFRTRGIPAYGLSPFTFDALELLTVHAPDERISLAAFDRGVARMKGLVRDLVTERPTR
ncbi:MAG: M20/M25/M40 family metallo-hydrolase [Thermoanaerobaculia bacterium]